MPQFDWPPKPLPGVTAAIRDADSEKASFRRNAAISLRRAEGDQREPAIAALLKLVEDGDRTVRIEAINSAADLRAASLAPKIVPLLESDDADLRVAALGFSFFTEREEDIPVIERLLREDGDEVVRCTAIDTLSMLDPDRADEACRRLLDGDDPMVDLLRTAMAYLRGAGSLDDVGRFARLLEDPRPSISLEAAASLAHLEDPRSIPRLLEEALDPTEPGNRLTALEGLCRTADSSVHAAARKRLSSLFARRDEKIYWAGILAAAGDARSLERVRKAMEGGDAQRAADAMRVAGLCSLAPLVTSLRRIVERGLADESALVTEAIMALGQMRCAPAAEALASFTKSRDEDVADFSAAALEDVKKWI